MEQNILDILSENFGSRWVDLDNAVSVFIKEGFTASELQEVFEILQRDNSLGKRIIKRGVSDVFQIQATSA